jgi:hypothetical protein
MNRPIVGYALVVLVLIVVVVGGLAVLIGHDLTFQEYVNICRDLAAAALVGGGIGRGLAASKVD